MLLKGRFENKVNKVRWHPTALSQDCKSLLALYLNLSSPNICRHRCLKYMCVHAPTKYQKKIQQYEKEAIALGFWLFNIDVKNSCSMLFDYFPQVEWKLSTTQ